MKKALGIIWLMVVLSACTGNAAQNQGSELVVGVKTKQVNQINAVRIHKVPTTLLAKQRANLSFLLSGTIDKVLVKIGETIKEKQVLMSLYNPNLDPSVATNLAQLESVNAQIYQARRDVASLKELRKNNSTSKTEFERQQTKLKDLMAKQNAIKAQIDLANANQQESFIRAPFAGVVVAVNKQLGEFVQRGEVVVVLNEPGALEVDFALTKNLHDNLKLNQKITGLYDNQEIQLIITELSQVSDQTSHLRKVVMQVKNDLPKAIGQEVILNLEQVYQGVYQLPLESVVDDGINKPYVFVAQDGKAQKIYIKPLYIDNGKLIFNADENINYPVVVKGQSKLSLGMQLRQD